MAVTKEEIASLLSEKNGYPVVRSKEFVDDFLDIIANVLAGGGEINFRDNFRLRVVERKAKKGYNFNVKKVVEIPSKRIVKFLPGKLFNEKVLGCKK